MATDLFQHPPLPCAAPCREIRHALLPSERSPPWADITIPRLVDTRAYLRLRSNERIRHGYGVQPIRLPSRHRPRHVALAATGPDRRRTRGDPAHGHATGTVSIAGRYHSVGQQFAGRRITLRMEATLAHVVLDGVLARTIPLTLTPTQRAGLQRAHMPGPAPLLDRGPPG
jgi:hypothetical protein